MITLDDVERALRRGREEAFKRFFQRRVFIDDTVKELEGWAAFRPDEDDRKSRSPSNPGQAAAYRLAGLSTGAGTPSRRARRPKRSLSVRQRQEVQEVLWP